MSREQGDYDSITEEEYQAWIDANPGNRINNTQLKDNRRYQTPEFKAIRDKILADRAKGDDTWNDVPSDTDPTAPGGSENGPLYKAIEDALKKGKKFRVAVKGEIDQIKTAIDGIPTIIEQLKKEKAAADTRILKLTADLTKEGKDAVAQQAQIITDLNAKIAELQKQLDAAKQAAAQSNTQTQQLATQKASAEANILALQEKLKKLTAETEGITAEQALKLQGLDAAIQERDGLQSQLTTIEGAQAKILKMINEYGTSDDADRAAIITTLKTQLGALQSIMHPQTRGGKQSRRRKQSSKRKYKGKGSKKKKYRGGFVYNKSTTTSSPNTTSPNTTSPNTTSPNTTSSPNTSSSSTPGDDFGRGVTKKKKRRANSKKSGTRKKQKKSKVGTKQKKTAVRKHGKKCPVTKRRKKRCAK